MFDSKSIGMKREVSVSLLINQLRHGYCILSRMNWNSVSRVHISVAGVLGIAGFILAITKDGRVGNFTRLSDRSSESEKLWLVPGLQNLGNNCFLNVVLQALASCLCFQSYLHKNIENYESLTVDERTESFPLTDSLTALLEELCVVRDGRTVLSPRKVMLAMNLYIPNFNLTSQQDAAEAFLHLLSSLREEFSESYVPTHISLANVSAIPDRRIFNPTTEDYSEQKRWQQHYLGPFDGILGSILTCQSCSFEIMVDFEFFHSLPLSPVVGRGGTIMAGYTVEDCLKQFSAAEQIDNYQCSRCWHIAAVKYLLSVGGSEAEISNLRSCGGQDSCDCRNFFQLKALPWSNSLSRTIKQLSIARCPKILCIHLQRVSMNEFGEQVKLQGHIYFPLVLNLLPFMKSGVGTKNWDEHVRRGQEHHLYPLPYADRFNMQFNRRMLNNIYGRHGENEYLEQLDGQERECSTFNLVNNKFMPAIQGESSLPHTGCLDTKLEHMHMQSDEKVNSPSVPSDAHIYRLVSVVEHFGRAGSGHYTAYRRMRAVLDSEDHDGAPKSSTDCWFSISDSEVYSVSEIDVLAAEASLLFYERIS